MTTYALEKLIEAHNDVGFNREADHHAESRMAMLRFATQPAALAVLKVSAMGPTSPTAS